MKDKCRDVLISDFIDPRFMKAFKQYFSEIGINDKNWDDFFEEMNSTEGNMAYVRYSEKDEVIGFIQFMPIELTNWFFNEKLGFIREFWINSDYRRMGYGSELLELAERYFRDNGIKKAVLTTYTAPAFYEARGYKKDESFTAKNKDDVFVKELI